MSGVKPREWRVLRSLDGLCWEDSNDGGDGWVTISEVATDMDLTYGYVQHLLHCLYRRCLVERRGWPFVYALSEGGAVALHDLENGGPK